VSFIEHLSVLIVITIPTGYRYTDRGVRNKNKSMGGRVMYTYDMTFSSPLFPLDHHGTMAGTHL